MTKKQTLFLQLAVAFGSCSAVLTELAIIWNPWLWIAAAGSAMAFVGSIAAFANEENRTRANDYQEKTKILEDYKKEYDKEKGSKNK